MRGRELTARGYASFQRAAKADGADKSGLTQLTYAVMTSFACDAAVSVALANTLFFRRPPRRASPRSRSTC